MKNKLALGLGLGVTGVALTAVGLVIRKKKKATKSEVVVEEKENVGELKIYKNEEIKEEAK